MTISFWSAYNKIENKLMDDGVGPMFFNSRSQAREAVRDLGKDIYKVVRANVSLEHRLHDGTWQPLTA